jgi:hypothetical protein
MAFLFSTLLTPAATMHELRSIAIGLLSNPQTGWNIVAFAHNVLRAIYGLMLAAQQGLRGPRYVDSINPGSYELIA